MVSVNLPGTFQGEGDPVSMGRPGSSLDDTHIHIIYIYNIYVCVYTYMYIHIHMCIYIYI